MKLSDITAAEKDNVTLTCAVSKPDATVDWLLDQEILTPDDKYKIEQDGVTHTLTIQDVTPKDAGTYTARCGDNETSALLTVPGMYSQHICILIN